MGAIAEVIRNDADFWWEQGEPSLIIPWRESSESVSLEVTGPGMLLMDLRLTGSHFLPHFDFQDGLMNVEVSLQGERVSSSGVGPLFRSHGVMLPMKKCVCVRVCV